MFVMAGKIKADQAPTNYDRLQWKFNLPRWIWNKIYPIYGGAEEGYLEIKDVSMTLNGHETQATFKAYMYKQPDSSVTIGNTSAFASNASDRYFRIQFDLLIDTN